MVIAECVYYDQCGKDPDECPCDLLEHDIANKDIQAELLGGFLHTFGTKDLVKERAMKKALHSMTHNKGKGIKHTLDKHVCEGRR